MSGAARALRGAADIVAGGWCRGASAQDGLGNAVSWDHDDAVEWCATGALLKAVDDLGLEKEVYDDAVRAFEFRSEEPCADDIVQWNDHVARDGDEVAGALTVVAVELEKEAA